MNMKVLGAMVVVSVTIGCGSGSGQGTPSECEQTTEGAENTEVTATTDGPQGTNDEAATDQPALAGGWGGGDASSQGAADAAAFAVREQSRLSGDTIQLVSIAWVAQQVVSGINYRLGLHITRNGTAEQATAVVYSQPWTSTTELTSWTPGLVR